MRRRHRHVHAPHLVEHPLVLRVVHSGDDPGYGELLLGEEGDDEVVLVVAGDGGDDVGAVDLGPGELAHLAGVGREPLHAGRVARRLLLPDAVRIDLDDGDLVAGLGELAGDERADVAASGDDDSHQCDPPAPPARRASRASTSSAPTTRYRTSPSWRTRSGLGSWATPSRDSATTRATPPTSRSTSFRPTPVAGTGPLDEHDPGARVDPLDRALGEDPAQHPLGRPLHGGDGRDAETLVDGGAAGVVDPGDDPLDPVGLPGDAGDEDVRVVAVRHGGEGAGLLDAGLGEPVAVEADADDLLAGEVEGQAPERPLLPIDHGDGVARGLQGAGQAGTDPTAPDDDDVHSC